MKTVLGDSVRSAVIKFTFCVLALSSSGLTLELSITTPNGESHLLDGFSAHFEFYEGLQNYIGNKILNRTQSILAHSKIDIGQLLPNINADEYTFLLILHSLSSTDTTFTNQLLEFHSQRIPSSMVRNGKPQHLMSEWLRSNLDIPADKMYVIANSVVNSATIGLKAIPQAVVQEIFEMIDKSAVFLKAAKEGNIGVMNWLIGSVSKLELNVALDLAWHQDRIDIVKMLIENNVTLEDDKLIKRTNTFNESLLHIAVESKNLQFVTELLQFKAAIDSLDINGSSPLYRSVICNNIGMAKLLIENRASVNSETDSGNIALHAAALNANLNIANLLLGSGTEIDKVNKHGATPIVISEKYVVLGIIRYLFLKGLITADETYFDLNLFYKLGFRIEDGNPSKEQNVDVNSLIRHSEIVKNLYMRGGKPFILEEVKSKLLRIALENSLDTLSQCLMNIGARINPELLDTKDILFNVIKKGNTELVRLMLNEGTSANTKAANGTTALHVAAASGKLDVLDLLLKRGGDIHTVTQDGWCLLHSAARGGEVPVVSFLLKRGLDINCYDNSGNTPLFHAVVSGQTAVTKFLLAQGAQIKSKSTQGESVMHLAAMGGNAEIVNLLVDRGADIEATTSQGITPLLAAAERGNTATIAALIDRGASLSATTINVGMNALHLAAIHGTFEVIQVLLDKGMDVNSRNNFKETALHLAVKKWDIALAQLLIDEGANIDAKDSDERTPLHYAVDEESLQMITILLKKKVKINSKDRDGKTALDIAISKCNRSIINILLEKGGKATALLDTTCI